MCQQKRPEYKIVKPREEANPRLTVQELLDILIRFYLYQRDLNCTCENCKRNWRSTCPKPTFAIRQFIEFTTIYLLDYIPVH